ncbi:MAG: hypothetical protein RLZZ206_922 [Cyanobacteriota bacterium]|jgi:hypothetical protein
MSAFNWVLINEICPVCQCDATIRCQTHVASSFGGGEDGRFQNREYRLGDKMRWWDEGDSEYQKWRVLGRKDGQLGTRIAEEACYSECTLCSARLYAILRFQDITPSAVLGIGPEKEWPSDYWR